MIVALLIGYHEKAVKEHTREVQLSEASQDTIGTAIAHRKVGECLCALKKFKEALFHQNLHLEVLLPQCNKKKLAALSKCFVVEGSRIGVIDSTLVEIPYRIP